MIILLNIGFTRAITYDIKNCFEKVSMIDNPVSQTILFSTYLENIYPYQDGKLLNYKIYKSEPSIYIDYDIDWLSSNYAKRIDIKSGSGFQFDQYDKIKQMIIKPSSKLTRWTFNINTSYVGGKIKYQISKDSMSRSDISENINNYDIDYSFNILFENYDKNSIQNTTVYKIEITKKGKSQIAINSKSKNPIYIYSNYNCKDKNLQKEVNNLIKTDKFAIDTNTKSFEPDWKNNPSYNKSLDSDIYANDIDHDGVKNQSDNCPYIANPDQRDSNADWIGDMCSDDDGDGIVGYLDNCIYISNPDQRDINNNNIGDACEFDKDKDGIFDSVDNCINTPNLDQLDTDGDGIGDLCDNCNLYNPDQKDLNKNWIGDICEQVAKQKQEEKKLDKDKDGIVDAKDNCPLVPNPDQKDTDGDGIGDLCDNCPNIKNPDQTDKDKNGIGDICEDVDKDWVIGYMDNCPYIANPDQKDDNNNGIWNVCEDDDNDGIPNALDNCPNIYNPNQSDVDNDKIWDACDPKDDRFIESNKYFFVAMALAFICIFGGVIYIMIQKLNKNWQK